MRHADLICRLDHIDVNYQTAGAGWWENQGLDLDEMPNWPGDSIMLVSWPMHVITPRFNGDCTISGPYGSAAEALACAGEMVDVLL